METKESQWFIYCLRHPETSEIRYIGKTNNPKKRLECHVYPQKKRQNLYSHKWVKSLIKQGLFPVMNILEEGVGLGWQSREIYWIKHYRDLGYRLTNLTDGGDGSNGWRPTKEQREAMSRARKGRKQSPESIAKTRAAITGRKKSPEHIAKRLASAMANGTQAISQKAATDAAAKANKGRKQSTQHIENRAKSKRVATKEQVKLVRSLFGVMSHKKISEYTGLSMRVVENIKYKPIYSDL